MTEWINRLASLAVVAVYVVLAAVYGEGRTVLQAIGFSLVPLVLIWLPQPAGQFRGWICFPRFVDQPTPGCLLRFMGWMLLLLLLLPAALVLIRRTCLQD